MSTESRSQLKTYFETGDVPTEQQFCNFIESTLNLRDDCVFIPVPAIGQQPKIGIGTPLPQHKLDVTGDLKTDQFVMPTGATSGYVLTTDASGNGTWQASQGGGGGGTKLVTLEYSAVVNLKNTNTLDPGCIYLIPDAGTNSDQAIAITALATDQLSLQGAIIAKNADYQGVGDYSGAGGHNNLGVWYNTLTVEVSSSLEGFILGELVTTADPDKPGSGYYVGSGKQGMIVACARGNWEGPQSFVGQESGRKGNIPAGAAVKSELQPAANDIVIWNNLHYINLTGSNGSNPDTDTTNWRVISKDTENGGYITEVDFIEFELEPKVTGYTGNGWIQRRTDRRSNDVTYSAAMDSTFKLAHTALDLFQWGSNKSGANVVREAVFNNRNERGSFQGNILERGTYFQDNCVSIESKVILNTLSAFGAHIKDNVLYGAATISSNVLQFDAFIANNYISNSASISANELAASGNIYLNSLQFAANVNGNELGNNATINSNSLGSNANIQENVLLQLAVIDSNNMSAETASIARNNLGQEASITDVLMNQARASITFNNLDQNARIVGGDLSIDSQITRNNFAQYCTVDSNSLAQNADLIGNDFATGVTFAQNILNLGSSFSQNSLAAGMNFSNKTFAQSTGISRCHFGIKFAKEETITDPISRKQCSQGFSNFEGKIDLSLNATPTTINYDDDGHYLTEIAGVMVLTTPDAKPTAKTVDTILAFPTFFPTEFRAEQDLTVTMTHTPVASATAGKFTIEGGMDFDIVGRTAASDFLTLRDDGGVIRQIDASKLS